MRAAKLAGILTFPILSASLTLLGLTARGHAENAAETKMDAGEELSDRGQFEEAIARWKEAEGAFRKSKDSAGEIRALLQQAAGFQALGQHRLALGALNTAGALAGEAQDEHAATEVKAARGALCIFSREGAQAEPLLRESLKAAQSVRDAALAAKIENNLGILLSAQGHTPAALAAFEAAIHAGDPELIAKARKNMADAAFTAQDYPRAERFANEAAEAAAALPNGHEKANQLVVVAQLLQEIFVAAPEHPNALRAQAFRLDQDAAGMAEKASDQTALAFALGDEGALYEFEKRYPEALALSRRAVFVAQQAQSPDTLYRWEWQIGRLLAKEGQRGAAIQAYRRTVSTLQTIRNDIAIRHGNLNAHSSFRGAVGAVYFELADLLLQRADEIKDDAEGQKLLHEARDTAEMLKAAELEDYFQDDCVNVLKSKIRKVENISPKAAVIYIIPLPDRTELLVSLASGAAGAVQGRRAGGKIDGDGAALSLESRGSRDG